MTTYFGLDDLTLARRVVTIGAFDGVHRGHMHLLTRAVGRAEELGAVSTAVTFEPLPVQVLNPARFAGRICTPEDKLRHIAASGIDEVVTITFNHELSRQSPEEFLAALVDATGMRELWVGEAFALGRNRSGDISRITEIGQDLGFGVNAVRRLEDDGQIVSSSAIRAAIQAGDAAKVVQYLGRPFRVSGQVIHGAHLGRTIGYPTANVAPALEMVQLADGIYASEATLEDGSGPRPAMTYIGTRPTVNSGARLVETHLLDFDGDLYGQNLDVDVWHHLRGDMTFDGLEPLVAQLRADESATRRWFAMRTGDAVPRVSSDREDAEEKARQLTGF